MIDLSVLSRSDLDLIFSFSDFFLSGSVLSPLLSGAFVFTFFDEDSTRTRLSFEVAARRLGGTVVSFQSEGSSFSKGETLGDALLNIVSLGADFIVVRHSDNHFFEPFLRHPAFSSLHFMSAGHGSAQHPTQGLLDMFCINRNRTCSWEELSVAIVGDVVHSRVARSQVQLLRLLGCRDIRLIAPDVFLPAPDDSLFSGLSVVSDLEKGLVGVDVVSLLRIQTERFLPPYFFDKEEYIARYGFRKKHISLIKDQGIIIHPQPLNRGVEISSDVVDAPCCKIFDQVRWGVAVRMACFCFLMNKNPLHSS